MKIALLGATGFVGSALLKETLDRGHVVTAIVRHPEKLEKREGLTAKAGDVYDTASLATLIRGNEAIISAFNPGRKNPNLYDDQVRGTASIITAIKKAGIKRVLWVGGAGGLKVKPGVRVIDSYIAYGREKFESQQANVKSSATEAHQTYASGLQLAEFPSSQ